MARILVLRIPDDLDQCIEDAARECGSTAEEFILFGVLFYLELVDGGIIVSYTQEKHQDFIRLAAAGLSLRRIEKALGIGHGTAVGWNRKYEGRIADLCSGQMDKVLEAWGEARTQRVGKLCAQLRKLDGEILERNLADVSTVGLMRLALAYRKRVRELADPLPRVDDTTADRYEQILERVARVVPCDDPEADQGEAESAEADQDEAESAGRYEEILRRVARVVPGDDTKSDHN